MVTSLSAHHSRLPGAREHNCLEGVASQARREYARRRPCPSYPSQARTTEIPPTRRSLLALTLVASGLVQVVTPAYRAWEKESGEECPCQRRRGTPDACREPGAGATQHPDRRSDQIHPQARG